MIIRQTTIYECFCPHCHSGQMEQIFEKSFNNQESINNFMGQSIKCNSCGELNEVEDIVLVYPTSFIVGSVQETSKGKQAKTNEELFKWLKQ